MGASFSWYINEPNDYMLDMMARSMFTMLILGVAGCEVTPSLFL